MESKVIQEDSLSDPHLIDVGPGWAVAMTVQSPAKITGNEDAMLWFPLSERCAVLAVSDGAGGHASGSKASQLVLQTLKKYLERKFEEEETREALLQGIEAANRGVLKLGVGAAATLSSVEIYGNQIQSFHAGDSLTLLVGQRGRIKFQTIAHSPVGYAVEAGLLDEKEAMGHEDRHLVSNIIGSGEMRIEMGPKLKMSPRDTLLICSDGVYDNLHLPEIVEIIRKGDLPIVAQVLLAETKKRMVSPKEGQPSKPDDCSFILFRLKG